jgi:thiol peroxidase
MADITLRGNPIHTSGDLPAVGSDAPAFTLTGKDLAPISLDGLKGQNVVLNIFPSVDTAVCATSVREFNKRAAGLDATSVLCVSADLPFAAGRFCGAEGIDNVQTASTFRSPDFLDSYGVRMTDGPLAGLAARAVVVIDGSGKVAYTELVPEIAQEPDYDAALAAIS